jgi:hypothetical protein
MYQLVNLHRAANLELQCHGQSMPRFMAPLLIMSDIIENDWKLAMTQGAASADAGHG